MSRIFASIVLPSLSILAHATCEETSIASGIRISPRQSYRLALNSRARLGIRWQLAGRKYCPDKCVSVSQTNSGSGPAITSRYGASHEYSPGEDQIILEFSNITNHELRIDILKYGNICDSEACDYMRGPGVEDPGSYVSNNTPSFRRARISRFTEIHHSGDRSWSGISGIAEFGEPFSADFIWWKVAPEQGSGCCGFLDACRRITDPEKTSAMISGPVMYNAKDNNIPVFYRVEGCMGRPLDRPKDDNGL